MDDVFFNRVVAIDWRDTTRLCSVDGKGVVDVHWFGWGVVGWLSCWLFVVVVAGTKGRAVSAKDTVVQVIV